MKNKYYDRAYPLTERKQHRTLKIQELENFDRSNTFLIHLI